MEGLIGGVVESGEGEDEEVGEGVEVRVEGGEHRTELSMNGEEKRIGRIVSQHRRGGRTRMPDVRGVIEFSGAVKGGGLIRRKRRSR